MLEVNTSTTELRTILGDLESVWIRLHKINLSDIHKFDKIAMLHSVQELANGIINQSNGK